MAMRLSGLMSGMDTESIVSQLVEAKKTKVTKAVKAQKTLKYKQDAWKTLNAQIVSLYDKSLANMRFESSFKKKTTKVSNSNVVSVITGENAMNSVQSLNVDQLAKTGFLTGGKLPDTVKGKDKDGNEIDVALSGSTTLGQLGLEFSGGASEGQFKVSSGGNETTITVNKDTTIDSVMSQLREIGLNVNLDTNNGRIFISAKSSGADNDFKIEAVGDAGGEALESLGLNVDSQDVSRKAQKTDGQNAKIRLNGVEYTSDKNSFEINGLSLTVSAETPSETVTITTEDDISGVYDMIKDFLKDYNALINQMDKLYNADSAKGYEPLTDEEKEAMSDSQIEEWETKIKDSILRKDSSLNTISTAMKTIMMEGVEVNGKKMYLSNFGINTLSYFTAPENEKNAYHIDGDSDDSATSGNADKLKTMIANDPDTVISFFTQLATNLREKMFDVMGGTEYSSVLTAYDDKKMQTDYDDYTTKIKELEDKLADYEDKWYAKFAAMETAMAKMQNNASAVTALLGG